MSSKLGKQIGILVGISFGLCGRGACGADPDGLRGMPAPGLLRELTQRQTDLAILELDIKKAELEKRLREAKTSGDPMLSPPLVLDLPANAIKDHKPAMPAYSVQRIHRLGQSLSATLLSSNGETVTVFVGSKLGDHLVVDSISAEAVLVRLGEQPPARLRTGPGW